MSRALTSGCLVALALLGCGEGTSDVRRGDRSSRAATRAALCDPTFLRPVAPLSTARATTRRPALRFSTASPEPARLELCRDRACTDVIETLDASRSPARPARDLPPGVVFWRLSSSACVGPTWQLRIPARSAGHDASWGSVLDVDGDGRADLAAGAMNAPITGDRGGRAYVYQTSRTGRVPARPTWTLAGLSRPDGLFGMVVASAGDVDGDGFVDLLVAGQRRVFVYRGSATGISGEPATILLGSAQGCFDTTADAAGDVDGDGYADVIVGDHCADLERGRAYVFLGGPAGLERRPGFTLFPPAARVALGYWVGPAGDVNGDGYADVLVRDRHYVHLFVGSPEGLASEPARSLEVSTAAYIGDQLFPAGELDLDGDGFADLVLPREEWGPGTRSTELRVYFGGATGLGEAPLVVPIAASTLLRVAADFDRDGFDELLLRASDGIEVHRGGPDRTFGGALVVLRAPLGADWFGEAARGAGDVDGDGYEDLVVGAPAAADYAGRVYVYRGGPEGLGASPAVSLTAPDGMRSHFGGSVASL